MVEHAQAIIDLNKVHLQIEYMINYCWPEFSLSKFFKKKWTHPRFLHRGPKKAVEQDSDVHFDLT